LLAKPVDIQSISATTKFFNFADSYTKELNFVNTAFSEKIYENCYTEAMVVKPIGLPPTIGQNITNSTNSTLLNATTHFSNTISYYDKILGLGNYQ